MHLFKILGCGMELLFVFIRYLTHIRNGFAADGSFKDESFIGGTGNRFQIALEL